MFIQLDYLIREVPNYGFLPIVQDQYETELYRGEFHPTASEALSRAMEVAAERRKSWEDGNVE